MATEKKDCYIHWDKENVYTLCTECFKKDQKGMKWPGNLYGKKEIKCSLCDTIIYQKKKKEKIEQKLDSEPFST